MESKPEILELVGGQFNPVQWSDFVCLPVREIMRRPFVLKAHGLYFVGDGWETDVGKIVARKHPYKVHHLMEWFEIVMPYLTSEIINKPLVEIRMRKIDEGNASEVLARIMEVTRHHAEVLT